MAGWVNRPDGTRMWQADDGSISVAPPFQPIVPFGQSPGRTGNLPESVGNFVADNTGVMSHNLGNEMDSIGNAVNNFVMRRRGGGVMTNGQPAPAPPPEPRFGPVPGIDIDPRSFGIGTSPSMAPIPDAPTLPPPPDRTVDPALTERETYMHGREGRIHDLYSEYLSGMERDDPNRWPWWRKLGAMASAMGAGGDLAHAGEASGTVLQNMANYRQQVRDAVMRMGLSGEDVGMDTENATIGRMSGEHSVQDENAQGHYATDVTNLDRQDTRHVAQVQDANQTTRTVWQENQQLAEQRFAQAMAELHAGEQAAAAGGGQAGLAATESMFGRLPENLQVGATSQQAMRGLTGMITQAREPGRIHAQMEAVAGHSLPRMPDMNQHSAQQIAQWYVDHGVNLASPAVVNAFPGFGAPGN